MADGRVLSAREVARFLAAHPQFLSEHPEILDGQHTPGRDQGKGVVDLQRFMVERLRGELADAKTREQELLEAGRGNLAAQDRVHRAVLALMAARSFEHLIETVTTDLGLILAVDVVTIGVEKASQELPPERIGGVYQLEPGMVSTLIGPNRRVRLRSDVQGDPSLYGAGAGLVTSDALVRLDISRQTPYAMLALGTRSPDGFHPGQGTELLAFLGCALELCIRTWLDLPA